MCSYLTVATDIAGSAKGPQGWFSVTSASVYFDHPFHAPFDHALNIDFADPSSGPTPEVVPAVGRRILVVDDNTDSADLLLVLLERLGNEVRAAYDGEAGVLEAAEFGPDVVFCDIGMPKMNGYEVARRLREQPWSRELVLVALTGWGQEDDRKKSAAAGFDFHLVKPVDPSALKQLLAGLAQTST